MPNAQQAVCCNAGCAPAESPVGLLSVHARTNIRETPHYSKPPTVIGNSEVNHQKDKMQHHYWVIAQIPQLKNFDMSKIFCNGFSSIFRQFLTKLQ